MKNARELHQRVLLHPENAPALISTIVMAAIRHAVRLQTAASLARFSRRGSIELPCVPIFERFTW